MVNKKRKIFILAVCAITLMLAGILGTYAYFMVSINNDRRQEAEIDTGTMRLRFADGDEGINATLLPNETIVKKFTLENTGTLDATVSIEWLDMINTYTEGSLTYTLEYSESQNGNYTEIVSKTNVPTSSTEFTSTLVPDITIPVGKTYYYNLVITFNDLEGIDQTSDYDAKFVTRFIVSQPSTNRKYTLTIDPNGGTIGGSNEIKTISLNAEDEYKLEHPDYNCLFKWWKISGLGTLYDGTLTMSKSNVKVTAEIVKPSSEITIGQNRVDVNEGMPVFANPATTNEGVFACADDYGASYYYRGAVDNNYLKFGQNTSGEDMWWRIIRVNGDGSLRILYDGAGPVRETTYTRGFTHTGKAYNAQYDDNKYVGWMFGGSQGEASISKEQAQRNETNSDIKTLVDAWYKETITDKGLGDKVADVVFCNDRSTPGKSATGWSKDTGLGYGKNMTAYGATSRTNVWSSDVNKVQPQFTCPQKNDAFTVSDEEKGNGDLTYPVGLITADEIVTAGSGKYYATNVGCYLARSEELWFWSLSPHDFDGSYTYLLDAGGDSHLGYARGSYANGSIAPVINLKAEYAKTMIGTGTMNDPYRSE